MRGDIERVDDEFIMFPQPNETICRISSFEPDKKYQNVASVSASYFSDLDAENVSDDIAENTQDTTTLLEKYIDELDVDLNKKRLKNTMKALYLEACDLEL